MRIPSSSVQTNEIPRLLNEKFTVTFYDGGIFDEGSSGGTYDINNVLVPTRDSFHCSDNGTHKNLVLKCSSEFTLTHVFVQAPRRRCTEPIRNCLVWVSETEPDVESTKYYDEFPIEVVRSKFSGGEPIIVTTSRESLEGEAELRPWRTGVYVHIKLFDTHSETQENIDIAAIGLVGFQGRVPFVSGGTPPLGPWSRRQITPPRNVHSHALVSTFSNRGWCCDGRDFSGGCRGGFNDFNETSVYEVSFRCGTCGFDLCDYCAGDESLGKVTAASALSDLNQLRTDRGAQGRRVALNRVKTSLKSDPSGLGKYLEAGILTSLSRTKFMQSREAIAVFLIVLNRLIGSREDCDMWAVSCGGEVRFVSSLVIQQDDDGMVTCSEILSGNSLRVHAQLLVPVSNSVEIVRATAIAFEEKSSSNSPLADFTIENFLAQTLSKTVITPPPPGQENRDVEMELVLMIQEGEEEVNRVVRSAASWLAELRERVGFGLIDQLVQAESLDQDLVKAVIRMCPYPSFGGSLKLLTLRLLNSGLKAEVDQGLELLFRIAKFGDDKILDQLDRFRANDWIKKVAPADMQDRIPSFESSLCPAPGPEEEEISVICEKILRMENFQVYKKNGSAGNGFGQVTSSPVQVSLANSLVEFAAEPLASLESISRLVLLTQPVAELNYLRYCYELVGCFISLDTAAADEEFLVTGFEIYSDLRLGVHSLISFSSTSPVTRRIVLSAAKREQFLVIRRERPVLPQIDLRARLTLERILNPNILHEYRKMREDSSNLPHSISSIVGYDDSVFSDDTLPSVLEACLGGEGPASVAVESNRVDNFNENIYSVRIAMDTAEIPFELIWPMIREEVFEAIRPFMSRSWPGYTLLGRLEQTISSSVNAGGFATIARSLSRAEADGVAARVSGVIQVHVLEDREGSALAAGEAENGGFLLKKIGERVTWNFPPSSSGSGGKNLTGFIVSSSSLSFHEIIDEASGFIHPNVPRNCVGSKTGASSNSSVIRARLRDQLRQRIMEMGNLQHRGEEPGHDHDDGEAEDGEAEREEDDGDEEEVEEEYVGGLEEGSSSMDSSSPRRAANFFTANFTLLEDEPSSSSLFMSIGDLLSGIGFGAISEIPPSADQPVVLTREIEGLARGPSLTAPIGERFSADDLLVKNHSDFVSTQRGSCALPVVELRAVGGSWMKVEEGSNKELPLLALMDGDDFKSAVKLEFRFLKPAGGAEGASSSEQVWCPSKRQRLFLGSFPESESEVEEVASPRQAAWCGCELVESLSFIDSLDKKIVAENQVYQLLKNVLFRKISQQLEQTLFLLANALSTRGSSTSSNFIPDWVRGLCELCPSLIPESLRIQVLRLTSFPASLTVHWIQTSRLAELLNRRAQIQSDLNTADTGPPRRMQQLSQELSNVEERIVRNPHWFGCVKSCLVKLRKNDPFEFLAMSDALLKRLSVSSSLLLEIQFEGESGFGSAVTRSFFSELGKQLQRTQDSLWISNSSAEEFIAVSKRGLRLKPRRNDHTADVVIGKARMLGRLIARALAEGYIVPLPISLETWAMIRDPSAARPDSALPMPGDLTDSEFVGACAMGRSVEQYGAIFVENGFSGEELIPNGKETMVTNDNVEKFLALARKFFLHDGIDFLLAAIRQGIDEVMPVDSLLLFTAQELKTAVCGEDEITWSDLSLRDILVFHEGVGSDVQDWLVEILLQLNNQERSTFLDFVTSCPRLPPGGNLRIDVFPETIASSNLTSPALRPSMPPQLIETPPPSPPTPPPAEPDLEVVGYPRSRACVNHLYLPRFRSRQTLRERLLEAMVSSVHHDEITS